MDVKLKLSLLSIAALSLLQLSGCSSGDSSSKDVKFNTNPQTPIVIDADYKEFDAIAGEVVVRPGPWFGLRFYIKNQSTKTLVIAALKVVATNFNKGSKVTNETSITIPASCEPTSPTDRINFARLAPGDEWREDGGCLDESWDLSTDLEWRIFGLNDADSFNYSVEVIAEGYFINSNGVIDERLYKRTYFITR